MHIPAIIVAPAVLHVSSALPNTNCGNNFQNPKISKMKKQLNLSRLHAGKLSLNKKTISNLKPSEMTKYVGGASGSETCGPGCHITGHECRTYRNGKTCEGHASCYTC